MTKPIEAEIAAVSRPLWRLSSVQPPYGPGLVHWWGVLQKLLRELRIEPESVLICAENITDELFLWVIAELKKNRLRRPIERRSGEAYVQLITDEKSGNNQDGLLEEAPGTIEHKPDSPEPKPTKLTNLDLAKEQFHALSQAEKKKFFDEIAGELRGKTDFNDLVTLRAAARVVGIDHSTIAYAIAQNRLERHVPPGGGKGRVRLSDCRALWPNGAHSGPRVQPK